MRKIVQHGSVLPVAVVTTSFPVAPELISGIFIEKLVLQLSKLMEIVIVAPDYVSTERMRAHTPYHLCSFRYGPKAWQRIAHCPGGIPVALSSQPLLYLLLPLFFGAMFIACLRISGKVSLLHANWSINGLVVGIAGMITGVPVVTTLRGSDVNARRRSRLHLLLLKGCLFVSRRIVTVSDAIRTRLAEEFPQFSHKLITIPNGVDETLLQLPIHRERSSFLRLLSVGNLVPNKGFATILEALNLLPDTPIHLGIVGDGSERNNLEQIAEAYGQSEKVRFFGALAPEGVEKKLLNTDLFVLASFSEGRPNVVLEAMAAGVPVIASDLEGVRELIEDGVTGLLFEPGNSRQLAACIRRLAYDSVLRSKLAKTAREFIVRNELLWSATARRYAALYREIAGNRNLECAV